MASFDQSKAYAVQEEVYFNDGREIELLHYVYGRDDIDELRGSPEKVLAAIDEYGRKQKYLMNVGEDKGKIVTDLIAEHKPNVMVELGGYVGYSSILFASALQRSGGKQYLVLEKSPEFAAVVASMADLAGLSSVVKVIVGASDVSIRRLHAAGELPPRLDMVFLDHIKPAYLPDLKLLESLGLIGEGTVLAADNVIKPGNPPYLAYVRATVEEKKMAAVRTAAGAGEEQQQQQSDATPAPQGDPSLIYESKLLNSFEPTGIPDGVEVTKCVGKEGL